MTEKSEKLQSQKQPPEKEKPEEGVGFKRPPKSTQFSKENQPKNRKKTKSAVEQSCVFSTSNLPDGSNFSDNPIENLRELLKLANSGQISLDLKEYTALNLQLNKSDDDERERKKESSENKTRKQIRLAIQRQIEVAIAAHEQILNREFPDVNATVEKILHIVGSHTGEAEIKDRLAKAWLKS